MENGVSFLLRTSKGNFVLNEKAAIGIIIRFWFLSELSGSNRKMQWREKMANEKKQKVTKTTPGKIRRN